MTQRGILCWLPMNSRNRPIFFFFCGLQGRLSPYCVHTNSFRKVSHVAADKSNTSYFSHKLLGEIYSDAWLRCEKSKSLFDALLYSTQISPPRWGKNYFYIMNKAVNKKSRIQAKTIILSTFCSEIFFLAGGGRYRLFLNISVVKFCR